MAFANHNLLPVEDGSQLVLDPRLRAGAHGETDAAVGADVHAWLPGVAVSRDVANRLLSSGWATSAGQGLFDQPDLCSKIFDWDMSIETEFLIDRLKGAGRGIEYGVGTGRILLAMQHAGISMDGLDSSESTIDWLRRRIVSPGNHGLEVFVADMADFAAPGKYGFGLAGLNTLRYCPNLAAVRRHLHMAGVSIQREGAYVALVASHGESGMRPELGVLSRWHSADGHGGTYTTQWALHSHHSSLSMDIERVTVVQDDRVLIDEYQTQIALSLQGWIALVSESQHWELAEVCRWDDGRSVKGTERITAPAGNYWLVLERV